MITRLSKEELNIIKHSKESVIYSEDGTRLLKVRSRNDWFKIKDGTKVVCDDAFKDNEYLHDVIVPDSVAFIGKRAFLNCKMLFTVDIPEGITIIEGHCFEECEHLTNITLPSTLAEISDSAFKGCKSLHKISLPSKINTIDKFAFQNSGLETLDIESEVECKIYERAFCNCINLISVKLGKNAVLWYGMDYPSTIFGNCCAMKTIEFDSYRTLDLADPETLSSLLQGCKSLEKIIIPESKFNDHFNFNAEFGGCLQSSVPDFNSLIVKKNE